MYITQFGGYTLPSEQLDMQETGGLARRGETQSLGGVGGALDLHGTTPDPLAADTISKRFILQAASESALQTAVDGFIGQMMLSQNDWRQGQRVLVATLPDGTKRGTWAKCTEARWEQEYYHFDNAWLGPVSVTFLRTWPVWWTYTDLLVFGDHMGTFADAAAAGYDFGQNVSEETVNSSPHTFTITNGGNQRVIGGLIEFDGVITNPLLVNAANKYSLSITRTLQAGDRYTLNLANFVTKLNGVSGFWPDVTLGSARAQLYPMVLEPGDNDFTLTSTSPNCTLRYYWARQWS